MLQLIESKDGVKNITAIALDNLPITIGRGQQASYQVANGDDWAPAYRASLSRIQATILRQHGQLWLTDGGAQPSANGIYVSGRKCTRPIKLAPGADIELALMVGGCGLRLVWPVEPSLTADEPPTLQFERDTVGAELDWSQRRVANLEQLTTDQGEQLNKLNRQNRRIAQVMGSLKNELRQQQQKNVRQDLRIAKARQTLWVVCGVVGVGSIAVVGFDVEQLDKVVGGCLAVTSLLAAASSTNEGKG